MISVKSFSVLCFWCGREREVAGVPSTFESDAGVADYEPCEACAAAWDGKCVFIEIDDRPVLCSEQEPLTDSDGAKYYPTGRIAVLSADVIIKEAPALPAESINFLPVDYFMALFEKFEPICFWCEARLDGGEHTDGAVQYIEHYFPCAKCRTVWGQKVTAVEFSGSPILDETQLPIDFSNGERVYPTGRYIPLETAEARKLFSVRDYSAAIAVGRQEFDGLPTLLFGTDDFERVFFDGDDKLNGEVVATATATATATMTATATAISRFEFKPRTRITNLKLKG